MFAALCFLATLRFLPETLAPAARRWVGPWQVMAIFARLLAQARFIVPALAGAVAFSSVFTNASGSPHVLMGLYGIDQTRIAWMFGINALGLVLAGQLKRKLFERFAPRRILLGAAAVNIAAGALLVFVTGIPVLPLFMAPLMLLMATVLLIGANATALAKGRSGRDVGSVSSIIGLLQCASDQRRLKGGASWHGIRKDPLTADAASQSFFGEFRRTQWHFTGTNRLVSDWIAPRFPASLIVLNIPGPRSSAMRADVRCMENRHQR